MAAPMKRGCLFIINGLGLGNSVRCHAVIEHLIDRGLEVHVLTSGNGLTFFADKPGIASLIPMESYFYSGKGGAVSGLRTLLSAPALLRLWRAKSAQLEALLGRLSPAVAITDSEYLVAPLRARRIPIVGLNNAEVIVTKYLAERRPPAAIRSQFWCVEYGDYLFHRRFCDLVLSPSIDPLPPRHPKFRRIGPIVRRAVRAASERRGRREYPRPRQVRSLVMMLSGSIYASQVNLAPEDLPVPVDVVGRGGTNAPNLTYHGKVLNNVDLLAKADALVVNGGFSAVSEAFLLDRPTFVIPVPGHAEQYINARVLSDLGRGFIADAAGVVAQFRRMWEADAWLGLGERREVPAADGALEAADAIVSFLRERDAARG
jgi:UDP:flavonoid glycosyltransferase YjiC (YdhE family)